MGFSKKSNKNEDVDDIFAVLNGDEPSNLHAIVNSGASKSIIGYRALNQELSGCTKEQNSWIMMDRSENYNSKFRFGKGDQETASHVIHLPVKWKNKRFKLKLHVISESMPSLIGIEAISKMGLISDLKQMMLSIGDVCEEIRQSDSGHIIWESL